MSPTANDNMHPLMALRQGTYVQLKQRLVADLADDQATAVLQTLTGTVEGLIRRDPPLNPLRLAVSNALHACHRKGLNR